MDADQANRVAGALLDRAPGAARGNVQRMDARRAQVVGVLQDLIPGGDLWRLMAPLPGDEDQGRLGSLLDWTLAVLDEEALSRVLLIEANDENRSLRVRVLRIPFNLITVSHVADIRTDDNGAHRLQRLWRFTIGHSSIPIDEDRILGAALDSVDRFTHELARRSGWPLNTDLTGS